MATFKSALFLLARRSKPFLSQRQRFLSTTTVVFANWNKDWKPGQIPRTPEERAAAAKKYGLRPEDYDCLVDSEVGDYPNLPIVSKAWRDPFEDYDHPGDKRNYGEPIHPEFELMGLDLYDKNAEGSYTVGRGLFHCFLLFGGFIGAFLLLRPYPYFPPQMPKQYPFNNLYLEKRGDPALEQEVKHYTFEPAHNDG